MITINENGLKSIENSPGKSLLNVLREGGIHIPAVCGGNGTCGKCKVRITQSAETREVLACKTFISGDAEVELCGRSEGSGFEILTGHTIKPLCPSMRMHHLEYSSIDKSLSSAIPVELDIPLNLLKRLSVILSEKKDAYLLADDDKAYDLFFEKRAEAYGVAVDIGTTTLVLELTGLTDDSMTVRCSHSMINSQRNYGADVISRISGASKGNLENLRRCVTTDIVTGIRALSERAGINPESIYKVFLAGNTTMIHLLLGIPCESLGSYPFLPTMTGCACYSFSEVFEKGIVNECADAVILPCVAAYVGSDITAGLVYAEDFTKDISKSLSLLVDLGTNGEMALFGEGQILCTSAAAGPAFEGGNISCGTGSIPGAICKASYNDGIFLCETIGGKEPSGICGSGLLDIASELLRHGLMDETGLLDEAIADGRVHITGDIFITQKDIRELQLAKSAVRAGIEILLRTAGVSCDDIECVFISGGFGHNLNVDSAVRLSVIPEGFSGKIIPIGNSSIGGCVKCMTSKESFRRISQISTNAVEVSLSAHKDFNELFIEYMGFDE